MFAAGKLGELVAAVQQPQADQNRWAVPPGPFGSFIELGGPAPTPVATATQRHEPSPSPSEARRVRERTGPPGAAPPPEAEGGGGPALALADLPRVLSGPVDFTGHDADAVMVQDEA